MSKASARWNKEPDEAVDPIIEKVARAIDAGAWNPELDKQQPGLGAACRNKARRAARRAIEALK